MREKTLTKRNTGHNGMLGNPYHEDDLDTPDLMPGKWERTLACVSNMDCEEAAGGVCVDGLCGCDSEDDCKIGTTCFEKECVPA